MGVVINYYNPKKLSTLRVQTEFCALKALVSQNSALRVQVLVADGSGFVDDTLQKRLEAEGVTYLSSDSPLGFAQGYNLGLKWFAKSEHPPQLLATCANDIFCDIPTLPLLAGALLTDNTVGCAIPYLSKSDYLTQNDWAHKYYREASSMTFNLNVFRTQELASLGFVPEQFSGYYNDIALMLELKARRKRVVLLDGGNVTHLGMATTSGTSMALAAKDRETFWRLYPNAMHEQGLHLKEEILAAGKWNKVWYGIQSRSRGKNRRFLVELSRLALHFGRFWHNIRRPYIS